MRTILPFVLLIIACKSKPSYIEISSDTSSQVTNQKINLPDTTLRKILSQIALADVVYNKGNDNYEENRINGFIVNGEYFVTCYHAIFKNGVKPSSVNILYNLQNDGTQTQVQADLQYQYQDNQYNFSMHHFDSNDRRTDVIILKLQYRINSPPLHISQRNLKTFDTIYGMHQSLLAGGGLKEGRLLYTAALFGDKRTNFPVVLGEFNYGSSGSPMFNTCGEIISMDCFGDDSFSQFAHDVNGLPDTLMRVIKEGYAKGQVAATGISINYLISRYGKGFF